jgi:hypothetical protein
MVHILISILQPALNRGHILSLTTVLSFQITGTSVSELHHLDLNVALDTKKICLAWSCKSSVQAQG